MTNKEAGQRAKERRAKMLLGGGESRNEAQRRKGKLIARERLDLLLDENSFAEHQPYITGRSSEMGLGSKRFAGDGVISGTGTMDGKRVFLFAQDFSVLGGSLGEMHAERIVEAQSLALKNRTPFIQINDSGGGIPEQVMPRLFDPFFTTKKDNESVGLGLSVVARILESHGAGIEIHPGEDGGTVVTVTLRRAEVGDGR